MHYQIEVRGIDGTIRVADAADFEGLDLHDGDRLTVLPADAAANLPVTWGDRSVPIAPGRAIRVPEVWQTYEYRGYRIPTHLIALTGAGPDTLELIGRAHLANYDKQMGLPSDMFFLDMGCGIGRDAFALMDRLGPDGRYLGVDVTRDSIEWCRRAITPRDPRFRFWHVDAHNELYNPFGHGITSDFRLPIEDGTVDRIGLASVFTHLLEDEVVHYMREFRRVLAPDGKVHASFFLHSPEAIASAATSGKTPWKATFDIELGPGVYANDPVYPRGAVAYTHEAMQRMMLAAGLTTHRGYVRGSWSGLYGDQAEEGQDAVILSRA
jgi:SAM-dependent methyltransferase